MFQAFSTFFLFFTTLFNAANSGARTLEKAAKYGEEATDYMLDEARIKQAKRLAKLREEE